MEALPVIHVAPSVVFMEDVMAEDYAVPLEDFPSQTTYETHIEGIALHPILLVP